MKCGYGGWVTLTGGAGPKNSSDTHKTLQLKKLPETDITNTVWDNSLSQRLEDTTNMAIQSDGGEWVLQEHK